ncbi:MAG: hypothetical protein WA797_11025 [Acidimicrobiales bacterium]
MALRYDGFPTDAERRRAARRTALRATQAAHQATLWAAGTLDGVILAIATGHTGLPALDNLRSDATIIDLRERRPADTERAASTPTS